MADARLPFMISTGHPVADSRLKDLCTALAALGVVLHKLPDSREKSLAITKFEECALWGNQAIALMADGSIVVPVTLGVPS